MHKNNINETLINNNDTLKENEVKLQESLKNLASINVNLNNTQQVLNEGNDKMKNIKETNEDIEQGYKVADKKLKRIKFQEIMYRGVLILVIFILGLVDVILLLQKMNIL